ncbi:MAG: DUF4355 domain-containing protein [Lachnospiraceae bacterium]|nr:DUF4355 domain-containing protein [Lachnospiraceae bacterium]
MAFEPITTQEEFDKAIAERISRAKETVKSELEKEYSEKLKGLEDLKKQKEASDVATKAAEEKVKNLEADLTKAQTESKTHELSALKTKAAIKHKIPLEMIDRINGSNADEIEKDAEAISKYFSAGGVPPLHDPESGAGKDADADYKKVLKQIKGESDG